VHCDASLKIGRALRCVWRHATCGDMGLSGVQRHVVPPRRLVHTGIFDQD